MYIEKQHLYFRFGNKIVLLSGYVIMLVGFIFYLPWGPGYPKLTSPGNTSEL